MKKFKRIAIVGTGLIGGSLGLAIKQRKLAGTVVGISRTSKSLAAARRIGAIDESTRDFNALRDADLIILCLPVGEIVRQASRIVAAAGKNSIICDVGSTKREITDGFAALTPRFVGCHPIAGSEKRGITNASRELFEGSLCIVTPGKHTDLSAVAAAKRFWSRICARVAVMKPAKHDAIMARVSHLPHAAAFALVNAVPAGLLRFSGRGFRDTTRLAASDVKIWEDIFSTNRRDIVAALTAYETCIHELKRAIQANDAAALRMLLSQAKKKRLELD
jgi:prephenate dehydrogenase